MRFMLENIKNLEKLAWRRWLLALLLVVHVSFSVPHQRDMLLCSVEGSFEETFTHQFVEVEVLSVDRSFNLGTEYDCNDLVICEEFEASLRPLHSRDVVNGVLRQKSNLVQTLLWPVWFSDLRGIAPPECASCFAAQNAHLLSLSSPVIVFLPTIILTV